MKYTFSNHISVSKIRHGGVQKFRITHTLHNRKMVETLPLIRCFFHFNKEAQDAQEIYKTHTLYISHVVSNFISVSFRKVRFYVKYEVYMQFLKKSL
jgi:hypothetical protein